MKKFPRNILLFVTTCNCELVVSIKYFRFKINTCNYIHVYNCYYEMNYDIAFAKPDIALIK